MNLKKFQLKTYFVLLLTNFLVAWPVKASTFSEVMKGLSKTGRSGGYQLSNDGTPKKQFAAAWITYINGLLLLIGVLFVILIIYGGWLWLSAQGNEEQVKKAKNLLVHTTIGLSIIIGARIITEFVIFYLGEAVSLPAG